MSDVDTKVDLHARYEEIMNHLRLLGGYKSAKDAEFEERKSCGHALINAIESRDDVELVDVKKDGTGYYVLFELEKGYISQRPDTGTMQTYVHHKEARERTMIEGGQTTYPAELVDRYLASVDDAWRKLDDEHMEREREIAERRARREAHESAVMAAYEAMAPDMKAGFKTMCEILSLHESTQHFGMFPPMATMFLRQIEDIDAGWRPDETTERRDERRKALRGDPKDGGEWYGRFRL